MTTDLAINLTDVAKTYRGKVRALRGIDMKVERGEVFGLLGPNGAGKSTLVKILMTVIRPSKCKGTVLGSRVGDKTTLARVGYLPEHHKFPEYLTGSQVLDYFAALSNVPRRERKRRAGELLELVGMKDWGRKKVGGYSKGMRQRIGIANALMNDPDLVLLDEPTDGVDPVGRRDIRNILVHLKEQRKTVFLNSHLLSELEMVCDRVSILVQGVVASQGTLEELTANERRYEIEVDAPDSLVSMVRRALPGAGVNDPPPDDSVAPGRRVAISGALATGEEFEIDRSMIRIHTTDAQTIQPLLDGLRAQNAVIKAVRPVRPSLEDLFMRAVTDPTTGQALLPGAAKDAKKGGVR